MTSGASLGGAVIDTTVEVVEGRVYGLGGASPVDGRLSWVADGLAGYAPLNCYVITTEQGSLIVDSSAPAYQDEVRLGLDRAIPDSAAVNLLLTRVVEFDSFGNAASIMRWYPLTSVHCQFPVDEWAYYRAGEAGDARAGPSDWHPLHAGQQIGIGHRDAAERVELFAAPLRLLVTYWAYDPGSRVLFTSDSFGHSLLADADDERVLTEASDTIQPADVRAHLLAKFDWLATADLGPVRRQIEAIFADRDIDVIAPAYGRPIVGADLVRRHYGLVTEALAELDAERENGAR